MSKPWFHPKRYGYGAGLPCSWEGWLLMAGLIAAMLGSHQLLLMFLPPSEAMPWWLGVTSVLVIGFALIARAKTEGGWHWRSGKD